MTRVNMENIKIELFNGRINSSVFNVNFFHKA
jgi:hypothetical protein